MSAGNPFMLALLSQGSRDPFDFLPMDVTPGRDRQRQAQPTSFFDNVVGNVQESLRRAEGQARSQRRDREAERQRRNFLSALTFQANTGNQPTAEQLQQVVDRGQLTENQSRQLQGQDPLPERGGSDVIRQVGDAAGFMTGLISQGVTPDQFNELLQSGQAFGSDTGTKRSFTEAVATTPARDWISEMSPGQLQQAVSAPDAAARFILRQEGLPEVGPFADIFTNYAASALDQYIISTTEDGTVPDDSARGYIDHLVTYLDYLTGTGQENAAVGRNMRQEQIRSLMAQLQDPEQAAAIDEIASGYRNPADAYWFDLIGPFYANAPDRQVQIARTQLDRLYQQYQTDLISGSAPPTFGAYLIQNGYPLFNEVQEGS